MLQLSPLLRQLTITDKDLNTTKFPIDGDFAWAQRLFVGEIERQYNNGRPVRIIVLKARQLGISTATEGVLFNWCFLHPSTNGLVIAHDTTPAEELFRKTKMYWETWPFRKAFTQKYSTRHELTWQETRSSLRVATAKNVASGRSMTIHAVHASEVALYQNPIDLMIGLRQSVPHRHGSIFIMESTAQGIGNWWHDEWLKAEEGESDFVPMFFPWYHHFEYQAHTTLCTQLELVPYERWLMRQGASYEGIAWRRWAIGRLVDDEQAFMQEYPATPEEAFISSGNPIFSAQKIKEAYSRVDRAAKGYIVEHSGSRVSFEPDPSGNLIVYKAPARNSNPDLYFIAGDPSMTVEGDPACIQVINRFTLEQMASWHGRIDPLTFADEMMRIGAYYGMGMLCPEVEGGGQGTIARILTLGYPNVWMHRWADQAPGKVAINYGWATNFQRKSWAIGTVKRQLLDNSLYGKIHDIKTRNQLLGYVVQQNGDWGPSSKEGHDDAVMAYAIAQCASSTEGPYTIASNTPNVLADIVNQEFNDDADRVFSQYGG